MTCTGSGDEPSSSCQRILCRQHATSLKAALPVNQPSMHTILYVNAVGEISGAERSLLAMLDALDATRWSAVVAAPDGALLAEAARRGARVRPLPLAPLMRPRSLPAAGVLLHALRRGWRAVTSTVTDEGVELVHANATPAMLYALRLSGVPVIWQVRDLAPLGAWAHACARRAARVAVISLAVRQHLGRIVTDDGSLRYWPRR